MKVFFILLFGLAGCFWGEEPEPVAQNTDAGQPPSTCMTWYHQCNCSYVCSDETAFNARLENGEGNCDVVCDPVSEEEEPTEPCEEVDGICQWITD